MISSKDQPRIRVVVRKRPLNSKELKRNEIDTVEKLSDQTIVVKEAKSKVDLTKYVEHHQFTFDEVFHEGTSNEELYVRAVQPLISATFEGAKTTVFAYGQTGSGKTHTMMGLEEGPPGMYLLAANDIFSLLGQFQGIVPYVSFYEIYCGKLFDLLNERELLHAREDAKQRVCIMGMIEHPLKTVEDLMQVISYGLSVRTTGVTGANLDSSRSHAVLQIALKDGRTGRLFGKMSFIDLAGSERGADTLD